MGYFENFMNEAADYDFRHSLRNTILLLGGRLEIAELLNKSKDGQITESDVDTLRRYNMDLIEQAKTRLAHLSTFKIKPAN